MQIALTNKFIKELKLTPSESTENQDSLYFWTANWTNVWSNRKEDMLVLINNTTRFTVCVYPFKRNDFKNLAKIIPGAIKDTFEAMNLNPEIIERYMAGINEIIFTKNSDRKAIAALNKSCLDSALIVADRINRGIEINSSDVSASVNSRLVNCTGNGDSSYQPYNKLFDALAQNMNLPRYDFKAFELMAELDLERYKARRRIIVPADITFDNLHIALQRAFGWKNYHSYEFKVLSKKNNEIVSLINYDDILPLFENVELMHGKKLSDYLYSGRKLNYIYDMGDYWEHSITLVKIHEHCNMEIPYLVEAEGKTPPEDVGGVYGYLDFLEIISDPGNPRYHEMKAWVGYWNPELSEYDKKPRVLDW